MNHNPVKSAIRQFGLPRIIIVGFFIFLVIAAGGFQMNLMQLLRGTVLICRFFTKQSQPEQKT